MALAGNGMPTLDRTPADVQYGSRNPVKRVLHGWLVLQEASLGKSMTDL